MKKLMSRRRSRSIAVSRLTPPRAALGVEGYELSMQAVKLQTNHDAAFQGLGCTRIQTLTL